MKAGLLETHHLPNPGQQPASYPDMCLKPSETPQRTAAIEASPARSRSRTAQLNPSQNHRLTNSYCFIPPSFGEVCYTKTDTNGEGIGMVVKENLFYLFVFLNFTMKIYSYTTYLNQYHLINNT